MLQEPHSSGPSAFLWLLEEGSRSLRGTGAAWEEKQKGRKAGHPRGIHNEGSSSAGIGRQESISIYTACLPKFTGWQESYICGQGMSHAMNPFILSSMCKNSSISERESGGLQLEAQTSFYCWNSLLKLQSPFWKTPGRLGCGSG